AAVITVGNCGVFLLATAHAPDKESLSRRPIYREILETKIFQRLIRIDITDGVRRYYTEVL
ncbi:MAG: stage III sporulation protein AB, partial [Clostridia bacterium]|nr:stage III sporulation protein AB [Clostridia bacterium]